MIVKELISSGLEIEAIEGQLHISSSREVPLSKLTWIKSNKDQIIKELTELESSKQDSQKQLHCALDLLKEGVPIVIGERDDSGFIDRILKYHTNEERHNILSEYKYYWGNAADAEPIPIRKQNTGRFAANNWLRKKLH